MKFHYSSGSRPLEGYTIKRGIGRGGFGEVYFALSDAGKEVALKRIERNLEIEVRGVSQCLNLKHVNLIDLFDIRHDDHGETWVVMEYVAGPSLKDVLDHHPHGLPLDEVRRWFRGIAAGVAYLHDHGIVHRDLKPGNVFDDGGCDRTAGTVKIGDYGLSKFISCSRRSGQTESVGTFHYMAPEIGKGIYGKEIDVYALGVVLYEMLTGRVPFEGESSQEIIMKHLTADPDTSGIPEPFRTAIHGALKKDPEQRYHDVPAMLAIVESSSTVAEAISGPARGPVAPAVPRALPPVRAHGDRPGEPLYIGDDAEGIEWGPVQQRGGALREPPARIPPVVTVPARVTVVAAPVVGGSLPAASAAAGALTEEPIAKAVKSAFGRLVAWWNTGPGGTPLKMAVLIGAVAALIFNSEWLVPTAVALGAVYLVYLGIRLVAQSAGASSPTTAALPAAPPSSHGRRVSLEQAGRWFLQRKTLGDRIGELSGSMLAAAAVCAVVSLVMLVLGGKPLNGSIDTLTLYAWLAVSSTLGAWLVLSAGKFWESSPGEPMKRRFMLLVLGLVFGAASFALENALLVRLTDSLRVDALPNLKLPEHLYAADGSPLLSLYLVYFGGLLAILRWWKQSDPLRDTRLSVMAVAGTALAAWIWNMFWDFPQPWGFMLATTVSIAVQLSAPWLKPAQRTELQQQLQRT